MPARSAAPYAEPSSTTVSSSGSSEHRRDDLEPEAAARAAAGHAAVSRRDAELAQQLERVAQAVRDAFEHRADERAAIVAQREAREGAARVRVGVRRALALEVREEVRPSAPGLQRAASAVSSSNDAPGASVSRNQRSAPAALSITPIASHVSGTRVTEGVDARLRVVRVCGRAASTTPDVPRTTETVPGLDRRRRRARPPAGRPRPRSRWTRGRAGATRAAARARRAPRRSSAGARRRRAACPRRPPRRSPTRRSGASGRSPWEARSGGSARRRPARDAAATAASAP